MATKKGTVTTTKVQATPVKESQPDTYRLVHYLTDRSRPDGLSEYVVILQPGEDPRDEEFLGQGFTVDEVLTIDGDATSFPCSRTLRG